MTVRAQLPDYPARYRQAQRNQARILRDEGEALLRWAAARSPVDTGRFRTAWRLEIAAQAFTLVNDAADAGRSYGRFVRRSGADETVQREVTAELRRRAPRIARRLQKNLIDTLGGA